jgi:hypothetical protein
MLLGEELMQRKELPERPALRQRRKLPLNSLTRKYLSRGRTRQPRLQGNDSPDQV